MKLITQLKNGSSIVTNVSDRAQMSADGRYKLNPVQFKKKMLTTSRALAGEEFKHAKIIF